MNRSPYKLLAVDVDGTLLNPAGELSDANRRAVRRAHEAGLRIALCTGRSLTEARGVLDQLDVPLTHGVFVFGALVQDLEHNTCLHRNAMDPDLADRLVRHLAETGHSVLVLYDPCQAGTDYIFVEGVHNTEAYEKWLAFAPTRAQRVQTWSPRPYPPLRVGIIEHPDRIKETLAGLTRVFGSDHAKINSIYAPNYGLHVVECFAPDVNKYRGITQLADHLRLDPTEIAAIGDDINDLELIANAGLGAAMGNAIPPIRQAAVITMPTNADDGVAALIDRILAGDVPPPRSTHPRRHADTLPVPR